MPDQHGCAVTEVRVVQVAGRRLGLPDGDSSQGECRIACAVKIELVAADECAVLDTGAEIRRIFSFKFFSPDRPAPLGTYRCKFAFTQIPFIAAESELGTRKIAFFAVSRTLFDRDVRGVRLGRIRHYKLLCAGCDLFARDRKDIFVDIVSFRSFQFPDPVISCSERIAGYCSAGLVRYDLLYQVLAFRVTVNTELCACKRRITGVVICDGRLARSLDDCNTDMCRRRRGLQDCPVDQGIALV